MLLIIVFIGYKQYQVETYIKKQKETYDILKDKKRINYQSFVVHFLNCEINNTRNIRPESRAFFMPYKMVNLSSAHIDKDFDRYMVYCYFTKEEIEKYNIKKLISSDNVNEVVEGYFIIGEEKQHAFIKDIFNNPYDNRISHQYKFKGISIYQSKMIAMKKISGISPSVKINHKSDSLVINFYYNWAIKNNYVSSLSNRK